ncbi:MAG: carbohydrate kinase, partial [Vallitaleaceae bacterium]|nr:carbohydrate kinase [Vallitaleaceae bacterium]
SGAATPYMDSYSRGAIVGLTTETTSAEIYRALMEGVTYEMLLNIEHLEQAGIYINELRATGGGATSPIWLQMKADILNKKIVSLGAAQSGTLGCIMLAGVACGIYKNLEEAADVFVKLGDTYTPNQKMHEKYMKYYTQYKRLYAAIKSVIS